MNTLIKIIITTVIGLFGTLTEGEDGQVHIPAELPDKIEFYNKELIDVGCSRFKEIPCLMLKNKIDS